MLRFQNSCLLRRYVRGARGDKRSEMIAWTRDSVPESALQLIRADVAAIAGRSIAARYWGDGLFSPARAPGRESAESILEQRLY